MPSPHCASSAGLSSQEIRKLIAQRDLLERALRALDATGSASPHLVGTDPARDALRAAKQDAEPSPIPSQDP